MPEEQLQLASGQLDSMMQDLRQHIATQIPIFMEAKGIKKVERLAELSTIDRSTLYKILAKSDGNNKQSLPSLRSLLAIAFVLEIGINSLVS